MRGSFVLGFFFDSIGESHLIPILGSSAQITPIDQCPKYVLLRHGMYVCTQVRTVTSVLHVHID